MTCCLLTVVHSPPGYRCPRIPSGASVTASPPEEESAQQSDEEPAQQSDKEPARDWARPDRLNRIDRCLVKCFAEIARRYPGKKPLLIPENVFHPATLSVLRFGLSEEEVRDRYAEYAADPEVKYLCLRGTVRLHEIPKYHASRTHSLPH